MPDFHSLLQLPSPGGLIASVLLLASGGGESPAEFLHRISGFLGSYYLALALMNAVMAFAIWKSGQARRLFNLGPIPVTTALVWLGIAMLFTIISPLAYSGKPDVMRFISMPAAVRASVNFWFSGWRGPIVYSLGSLAVLVFLFLTRKFFVRPLVAWSLLNLALLVMGLSMTNPDFASIVTKPDNVPIVGLVFLLGFFTWLATAQAVRNDERAKLGQGPVEKEGDEKVLVWPDLVYTELICMVALTAFLLIWGILLQAPLEEPASSAKTPNPSKAPWYFLGLQEMLVYYDPWMAGVVLPSVIVAGLMAIPYIDYNKKGNGYYTIKERPFAYLTFQTGFLVMWVTLIVLGTFLRGPNWNFFGPYEKWDAHKVEALNNVDLSQYFWVSGLGMGRPAAPEGTGFWAGLGYILLREFPGIVLVGVYLVVLPPLLGVTVFRGMYAKLGFLRFMVLSNLILMMGLLPLKMFLRWTVNLKYIISIPEYFMNF